MWGQECTTANYSVNDAWRPFKPFIKKMALRIRNFLAVIKLRHMSSLFDSLTIIPKSASTRSKCKIDVWRHRTRNEDQGLGTIPPSPLVKGPPRVTRVKTRIGIQERKYRRMMFFGGGQGSTITCQGLVDSKYHGGIGRTPSSIYTGMPRLPLWRDEVHRFADLNLSLFSTVRKSVSGGNMR